MTHDFNKPPHVTTAEEKSQKKRLPVYILVLVGIFLVALLVYMFADSKPKPQDAPPTHPDPSAQPATPNNTETTGTATATDDTGTATATDGAVGTNVDTATEAGESDAIKNAADNVGVGKHNGN